MSPRIINRHRPLRSGEQSARYRRLRYAYAVDPDELDCFLTGEGLLDDRMYDARYWSDDDRYWWQSEEFDLLWFDLRTRISAAAPFNPLFPELGSGSRASNEASEVSEASTEPVERRLAEHLTRLPTIHADALLTEHDLDDLRAMNEVARERLGELYGVADNHRWCGALDPMVMILLFRPFWIRSPRSWDPPPGGAHEVVVSLVEHVFGRFPAPRFLLNAWLNFGATLPLRWLVWFVALAQGGSLLRLHRVVGWGPLPKKLPAYLFKVPPTHAPADGLMYAEVLRLGGSPTEFRRLELDQSFRIDPTTYDAEGEDRRFWENTVRWLARHRDALDELGDGPCERILQWARHRQTERHAEPFRWSGRTPAAAYEQAQAYRVSLWSVRRRLRWPSHDWDWEETLGESDWSIRELTTSEALGEESDAMSHCVAAYDQACAHGRSAIFSMKRDGTRCITIEVHVPTRQLVQVRGPCNRRATEQETFVLARWQREVVSQRERCENRAMLSHSAANTAP